jgi:hypothetical protein
MTKGEHRKRHELLHKHLDELVADFLIKTNILPSKTTVLELMQWSYTQSTEPSHTHDYVT